MLEELAKITPEAELACFASILTSIETDLEGMKERANAWADRRRRSLEALRLSRPQGNCLATLLTAPGFVDIATSSTRKWLTEAEHALATYETSFSLLPMRELVAAVGSLAQLAARGYTVTAP